MTFWRRRFSKHPLLSSPFPEEKWSFISTYVKALPQRCFVPSLFEIGQVVLERSNCEKLNKTTKTTTTDSGQSLIEPLAQVELKHKINNEAG